jgi:hypothetical protein
VDSGQWTVANELQWAGGNEILWGDGWRLTIYNSRWIEKHGLN